jgi:DNA helicase IV
MRLPSYQDLSKEQDRINNLPLDDSFLITGPPGTGKTVMALYRASVLQSRRRPVALLMHSRLLTQYTTSAIAELLIDGSVHTYDRWLTDYFWRHHRQPVPNTAPWVYDWNAALALVNSAPAPAKESPDLLVDEGQDLPKEFFILAGLVSSNLVVFADENQRLREANSTLDEIRQYGGFAGDHCFNLTRNYRNTREIAALAATYYTGLPTGIPEAPTRSGDLPVIMRHPNLQATIDFIVNFESANSDLEIGVLTPNSSVLSRVVAGLGDRTVNPVQHYVRKKGIRPPELEFDVPGIKVVNFASAKGLEFDAVFIPALQDVRGEPTDLGLRMTMYVVTSRARDRLFMTYSTTSRPPVIASVPEQLVEWRE